MTTISILVPAENIIRTFGHSWTSTQLNEYIAYQLKPYLHLHIFTYFDFEHINSLIDGRAEAKILQDKINILSEKQTKRIKLLQGALPSSYTWETLGEDCAGKELLELLAGNLTIKSQFYDIITRSSYISKKIIDNINCMPQKYILTEINLHN